jgi:hypothetical protein
MFQSRHITTYWDNPEETILIWELGHGWTWNEGFDAANALYHHIIARGTVVDLITVTGHINLGMPAGSGLARFKTELPKLTQTGLKTVHVNAPPLARTLARIYETMMPPAAGSIYFARTLDEARGILQRERRLLHNQPI